MFPLSNTMDLRHQSMCVIMLQRGGGRHTPVVCKERKNFPSRPAATDQQRRMFLYQPLSLSAGRNKVLKKAAMINRFFKMTISSKFLQTRLCHSQFQEQRPQSRSGELRSVASKSCKLGDRRANYRAFYRDAYWKFQYSRLKNPVLPWPPVEKCIHCLSFRNTFHFYIVQA